MVSERNQQLSSVARSMDDMKSISWLHVYAHKCTFSWNSTKQSTIAQSTAKAQYIACSAVANQCIWLRKLMKDFEDEEEREPIILEQYL